MTDSGRAEDLLLLVDNPAIESRPPDTARPEAGGSTPGTRTAGTVDAGGVRTGTVDAGGVRTETVDPGGVDVAFGLALHELSLALDRARSRLAEQLGLVPIDVNALLELHRRPGIRPGDLARALNLKAAGTTSATDRLARAGFVRRSADDSDRRGTRLYLTPAGAHAAAWVLERVNVAVSPQHPDGTTDTVDPAETGRLLHRLADGLSSPTG